MEKVDGVSLVSRQQGTPVSVEVDGKPDQTFAIGVDQGFFEIYELTMLDGTDAITGHQVLLSKSRADDLDAGVGDSVKVQFPGGKTIPLEVQGVFEDTPTTGGLTMPLSVLRDAGLKRSDSTVSIMVADGADRELVKRDLDDVVKDLPILSVQDKEEFEEAHQRPGQPAALRHLRPARPRGGHRRDRHRQHTRAQRPRAHPRDRPAACGRPVAAPAADDDHPGVGGDRAGASARCWGWCSAW